MNIGFIGTGIMGAPMAKNLIKAGYSLMVFNRTREKTAPLAALGARVADSPAQVAQSSDIIITIVSDTPDVESVLFGENGVERGLSAGKVVIDMSTISPEATEGFARRLAEKGCHLLDAPVTGGEKGAIEGTLTIMVGGEEAIFEKCKPVFEAMGKNIVYMGQSGNGQKTKLVNQVTIALNLVGMTEGLRLAREAGIDAHKALQAISSGAAGSWVLSVLGPRVLNNDFAPGFMIKLQQKDLRLALEFIGKLGKRFEGTELTYSLFTRAVEKGLGEQGTQGLINLFD